MGFVTGPDLFLEYVYAVIGWLLLEVGILAFTRLEKEMLPTRVWAALPFVFGLLTVVVFRV